MHRYREQIGGYNRGRGMGVGKISKKVNCIVKDGKQIFGGDHFIMYTDVELCVHLKLI